MWRSLFVGSSYVSEGAHCYHYQNDLVSWLVEAEGSELTVKSLTDRVLTVSFPAINVSTTVVRPL